MDLDLVHSTAVMLAENAGQVRIYTDLDDLRLLKIFKGALDFLKLAAPTAQAGAVPEVGVVMIVFDAKGKVFLHTNMPLPQTRALVLRLARDLLKRQAPNLESGNRGALAPFVTFKPRQHHQS